jgi:hypothetical protein
MEINLPVPKEIKASVIFSANNVLNIQKLTNVNGKNIYQIDMGDCLRYISPENSPVYIGIIYNDILHIFNLIEDGEFPDDFKVLFKNIDEAKVRILSGKLRTADSNRIMTHLLQFFSSIHDFSYIQNFHCSKLINLEIAKAVINDLNVELNKTCPNFKINIDYIFNLAEPSFVTSFLPHNPYTLLLCLFNDNNCVSSLTIKFDLMDTRKMEFDSRTDIRYEGRKFTKLLISVIIIIAKALDERKQFIKIEAINPIIAYLMIKSFNAISTNNAGETILDKTLSFEDIKSTIEVQPNKSVFSTVDLNDTNIQNAHDVFNSTIESINCGPIAGGNLKTKRKYEYSRRKSKRNYKRKYKYSRRKSKRNYKRCN